MLPDWTLKPIQMLVIFGVGSLLIYLGVDGIAVGFLGVVAASFVTLAYVRFLERKAARLERQLPLPRDDEYLP